MSKTALIALALVASYGVMLPVLLWGLRDMDHIPGGVWRHAARRPLVQWRMGLASAYALAGWPVLVAVINWRRSRERADLLAEWADLSARKRRSRRHAGAATAPAPAVAAGGVDDPSRRRRDADA